MAQEFHLGNLSNIWCAWKFRHVKVIQTNGKLMPKYITNNIYLRNHMIIKQNNQRKAQKIKK
jgi:hypothetical protein